MELSGTLSRMAVHLLANLWMPQIVCVNLVDAHHCSSPPKFISVLLMSLSSMVHLELPHVNILSKVDMIEQYG